MEATVRHVIRNEISEGAFNLCLTKKKRKFQRRKKNENYVLFIVPLRKTIETNGSIIKEMRYFIPGCLKWAKYRVCAYNYKQV